MIKNSFITRISVENPFYVFDGFKVIIERFDNKKGIKVVNTYDGITESSLRRLKITVPSYMRDKIK